MVVYLHGKTLEGNVSRGSLEEKVCLVVRHALLPSLRSAYITSFPPYSKYLAMHTSHRSLTFIFIYDDLLLLSSVKMRTVVITEPRSMD